ncbi:hypothetical protein LUZ60_012971 [Juncus effusus]|nr:hypothetical protein LUZ60_012971 [Juncus effusus]
MALSASRSALHRLIKATNSFSLNQLFLRPTRQSSSFPFGGDEIDSSLTTPKLFISGLSMFTTEEKLKEAFSRYGQLLECKVITDRITGRSKGFGFIRYSTVQEAEEARKGMNGCFLDGWVIFLDPAKSRKNKNFSRPENYESSREN